MLYVHIFVTVARTFHSAKTLSLYIQEVFTLPLGHWGIGLAGQSGQVLLVQGIYGLVNPQPELLPRLAFDTRFVGVKNLPTLAPALRNPARRRDCTTCGAFG